MTLMSSSSKSDDIVGLHPIQTTREEFRLCSRRLSQEFPAIIDDTSSVDVYYKENSVGVPFLWESRPGTPKIKTVVYPLPPLTPPPSFHATTVPSLMRKQSRNINLQILHKRTHHFDHSPSRSTSSSSSFSSPSRFGGTRVEEQDHHQCESPVSTLCFGAGRRGARPARSPGCSSTIIRLLLRDFS
ncbi:hypothetical protein C2S52_017050 [Perilla frutescens var. hirtella]|nr:hypothetical protein C2S52_017050 [Perilla frutescens var. hirtella]